MMSMNSQPISAAADAILTLINSRPTSPTKAEIAAIIAKAVPPALPMDDLAHWDSAVRRYLRDGEAAGDDDDASMANEAVICAEADAVWAKPVRSWADLVLRTAIAIHWNTGADLVDPAYPDVVLRESDPCYDELALAHVVRGILDLTGLEFDAEGRLLDETPRGA